jgi:hypothetical protein
MGTCLKISECLSGSPFPDCSLLTSEFQDTSNCYGENSTSSVATKSYLPCFEPDATADYSQLTPVYDALIASGANLSLLFFMTQTHFLF